ncbi:SidG protein, substrate of the Dot/Icm system [Legionella brunensis]|uniref:SidG protein, substrate of the Dot/Icm system n=2 Tax=Legionella brunensis TaxID=29422 RepID=A0A0W0SSD3_9GAMM|nr:SidG protein, substrate of the Dot/Icm system [Legionella brunensis]
MEYWEDNPLTSEEYLKCNNLSFEEYLKNAKQRIPTTQKKDTTHSAKYNDEGKLVKTDEVASETEYFKIEFSWWRGDTFFLSNTEQDMKDERKGKHLEYSEKAKEYLQPEQRRHTGKFGGQVMTYAPSSIVHQRDLSDTELKKVDIELQIERLKERLEVHDLLMDKVKTMKRPKVEGSLKLICNNIGLKSDDLVKDYLEKNPGEVDIEKFKEFFLENAKQHMAELKKEREALIEELRALEEDEENELEVDYVTKGVPPDHVVTLPYVDEGRRGLSPEAMLKKMRELTEPDAPGFNLHTKNCSKTSTDILTAGAEHDPLLKRTLSEEALGFFGTPQQVIVNAQRAKDIIVNNEENTLLTRIVNSNFLQKAMGEYISTIMDPNASRRDKGLAGGMLLLVALARLPGVMVKAFLNPTESMGNIISGVSTVAKHADSVALKGAVGLISALPLAILSPFALVEQGIKKIAKPFQALATWISKKDPSPTLDDQITTPLPSAKKDRPQEDKASYHSMMAGLVDKKVAGKVQEQSKELSSHKKPLDILVDFEIELENNPNKVITLSDKDFDKINKYITAKKDPGLTERFQKCCDESLRRANKLSPQTPEEVDNLIQEESLKTQVNL